MRGLSKAAIELLSGPARRLLAHRMAARLGFALSALVLFVAAALGTSDWGSDAIMRWTCLSGPLLLASVLIFSLSAAALLSQAMRSRRREARQQRIEAERAQAERERPRREFGQEMHRQLVIGGLDCYELAWLREFFTQGRNAIYASLADPAVASLLEKGIMVRIGDVREVTKERGEVIAAVMVRLDDDYRMDVICEVKDRDFFKKASPDRPRDVAELLKL